MVGCGWFWLASWGSSGFSKLGQVGVCYVGARFGWRGVVGEARPGKAGQGAVCYGWRGRAGLGVAQRGLARLGLVRFVMAGRVKHLGGN